MNVLFQLSRVPTWGAGLVAATALVAEPAPAPSTSVPELHLIGMKNIPPIVAGPRLGGLSGIDYDPVSDRWIAVSDDRGEFGPPRFYTLAIDYNTGGLRSAEATGWTRLDLPAGQAPDLESIRLDPSDGKIWYASEGDALRDKQLFVATVRRDGSDAQQFPLPADLRYEKSNVSGVRANEAIEGLTFSIDGKTLWTSIEDPLVQDGPDASPRQGGWIRLTEYKRTGEVVRQLAYPLDAVPASLAGGHMPNNGVAEILSVAPERLLVLERAGAGFADDRWKYSIRLYVVDLAGAENIPAGMALAGRTVQGVRKSLVLDFDQTGLTIDNLEGLSLGRRLPNGHDTLVLISDDNFISTQTTQLWVFELIAGGKSSANQPPAVSP